MGKYIDQFIKDTKKFPHSEVLQYFGELSRYPRSGGNEKDAIKYLTDFFKKNKVNYKVLKSGNILATAKGTKGYEKVPSVAFQGHIDMVLVSDSSLKGFDFNKDELRLSIHNNDIVKGDRTSIGADNRLAVAMMMDLLTNKSIKRGPIECLITWAEETTMGGANSLEKNIFKSNYLINLDIEYETQINLGSNGSKDCNIVSKIKRTKSSNKTTYLEFKFDKAHGGHSGIDIEKKIINCIVETFNYLDIVRSKYDLLLVDVEGGNAPNAIPTFCNCTIAIKAKDKNNIIKLLNQSFKDTKNEFINKEKALTFSVKETKSKSIPIDPKISDQIIDSMITCYVGPKTYNDQYKIFDCSNSIGLIKTTKDEFSVHIFTRGLYVSGIDKLYRFAKTAFKPLNPKFENEQIVLVWSPSPKKNKLLDLYKGIFEKEVKKKIETLACAGGLEVSAILKKNKKEINAFCIGPDIRFCHSINEEFSIKSLNNVYSTLLKTLERFK